MIKEQLQAIREEALKAVTESADMKEIDALRVKFLGKKGELTAILKQIDVYKRQRWRSVIARPVHSCGTVSRNSYQGSSSTDLAERRPCRTAR